MTMTADRPAAVIPSPAQLFGQGSGATTAVEPASAPVAPVNGSAGAASANGSRPSASANGSKGKTNGLPPVDEINANLAVQIKRLTAAGGDFRMFTSWKLAALLAHPLGKKSSTGDRSAANAVAKIIASKSDQDLKAMAAGYKRRMQREAEAKRRDQVEDRRTRIMTAEDWLGACGTALREACDVMKPYIRPEAAIALLSNPIPAAAPRSYVDSLLRAVTVAEQALEHYRHDGAVQEVRDKAVRTGKTARERAKKARRQAT